MRIRLADCNPSLRRRIELAIGKYPVAPSSHSAKEKCAAPARNRKQKGPNKTESRYNSDILQGNGMYEAITLRLPGGSRYTPDWVTVGDNGRIILHEVKGSYRFPSHGRALTAWREARVAFPFFKFVWAVKNSADGWKFPYEETE